MMKNKPNVSVEALKAAIGKKLIDSLSVSPASASNEQFYKAGALAVRDIIEERRKAFVAACNASGKKQVYYLSMEFLLGKSLRNSLFNLGIQDEFEEAMESFSVKLPNLYKCEPDPGLGNGGLGRLAACYLDGLATDNYYAMGYSILYEYGIFKQRISDGWQSELPDYWLPGGEVWLEAVPEHTVEVRFGGSIVENWDGGHHMAQHVGYSTVLAVPYNMYITGYDTKAVSLLRLWQARSPGIDMDLFNKGDYLGAFGKNSYAEVISKVLYPNDNHTEGKLLRLRQQYFLACSAIGDIFRRHMNDTHPTLAIPELMRVLLDECGYSWDICWDIVKRTFAYTNHTVMAEALEQWDMGQMQALLPRIYQIVEEINRRFCIELRERYHKNEQEIRHMSIICDGKVRMANLCLVGSHSVNGVSALHSQIIRDDIFKDFYAITPAKFKNVTNGIASRRWLLQGNPLLTEYIKEHIGDGFLHDFSQLSKLQKLAGNKAALKELAEVKYRNKVNFACFLADER
ncbi:MAG: glycogen/starch/alpha-glucan family phosphorylase, partial [Angelakisella sp.]